MVNMHYAVKSAIFIQRPKVHVLFKFFTGDSALHDIQFFVTIEA